MSDTEKILQLLRHEDEENVALGVLLAKAAAKKGLNIDFVVHELLQHQLALCFEYGWMLQYITEFYTDEGNLRFRYVIGSQTFEWHLKLDDDAIGVCEVMKDGLAQMSHLEQLTYVTLYPKSRRNFSFDFWTLSNLKNVHLEGIWMREISTEITQLAKLEALKVVRCDLSRVPPELGQLIHLKKLNIRGNGRWITHRNTHFSSEYTPLEDLPDALGNMVALQELVLDSNGLTKLPETLGDLKYLKVLSLKRNQIKELPESVEGLIYLQELDLSENPISESVQAQIRQWLPHCNIIF